MRQGTSANLTHTTTNTASTTATLDMHLFHRVNRGRLT